MLVLGATIPPSTQATSCTHLQNFRFRPSRTTRPSCSAQGEARRYSGPICGFAKGWLLPQPGKQRRRPIFEPSANTTCVRTLLEQRYPTRLQRRQRARHHPWAWEVAFSAYFDQFALNQEVQKIFVIKIRGADGPVFYTLTCLPMGANGDGRRL